MVFALDGMGKLRDLLFFSTFSVVSAMNAGGDLYVEDEARYPALKKGDCAEARFRMYELRLSSIVRRSARLLRVDDVTTRILCRFCVGIVTLGRRD